MYEYSDLEYPRFSVGAKMLLKLAFDYPSAYTNGFNAPQQPQRSIPWGKIGLGALAAAGGAYAAGKYAPQGLFGGFTQGVDSNVINPLIDKYKSFTTTPESEAMRIHNRMTQAGLTGSMKAVRTGSDLQGTPYYKPDQLENISNTASGVAGLGMTGHLAGQVSHGAASMVAPKLMDRAAATGVGKLFGGANKFMGRAAGPLGALMTVPDTLQLGDKINDSLGVQNNVGRGLIKGTAVAGGIGAALAGAGRGALWGGRFGPMGATVGGLIGGAIGGFAPSVLNGVWNYKNSRVMEGNEVAARANVLKDEFTKALGAKQNGNENPLLAWYGLQSPEQLNTTIGMFQGNKELQDQMLTNNPNNPQY